MKINSIQLNNSYYNQATQKGNSLGSNETIVKSGPVPSGDVTQFKNTIKSDKIENPVKSILAMISKFLEKSKTATNMGPRYDDWNSIIAYESALY